MTLTAGTAAISPAGWSVTGRLSVRGTSVSLAGDVELSGQDRVELSGQDRSATLTGHTQLDRRALGIRAPRIMIGREIDITVTAVIHRITDH